ncbi:hypothetical protein [Bradyrhizobium sp. LA6.12]|uniref:hypothetical protein n=1 Tax=unclassified Bradyrhizobium TaxID=2631580 RepID=UPI00339727EE
MTAELSGVGKHVHYGAFDLTLAFANASLKDGRFVQLVRALRNLEASLSIRADLEEAKKAIDACRALPRDATSGAPTETGQIFMEAVFIHALMLYCRAVHSSTKERHKIDVLGSYTPEQKVLHADITALRDNVVAHYGRGDNHVGGPWNHDHIVLRTNPSGFAFSYPRIRVGSKAVVVQSLLTLIEKSLARMIEYGTKKQNELAGLIRTALQEDDEFINRVSSYPFSEETFFGFAHPPGSSSRFTLPKGTPLRKGTE